MKVDNLPFAIPAVPDAGLLGLGGAGDPSRIHVLRDADVGDAGGLVSHQVNVGVQDCCVHRLAVPRPQVFEVESVEIQAFHEVAQSLRLEGSHPRVTHLRVGLKVAIAYCFDQLLCDFNDFLLPYFGVFVLDGGVGAL